MKAGLIVVIVLGVLLALFPVIVNFIDTLLYEQEQTIAAITTRSTTSIPENVGENAGEVVILVPQVESHTGADRLVVSPGKALVLPNHTIDVIIRVYFKHSQPCPYSNWFVNYTVQGDLEVVSDDGGKLINSKTYERILKVRVLGHGTITVTYYYGSGCPEGTKEQVKVELSTLTGNVATTESQSGSTSTTSTTMVSGEEYVKVSGVVESKDIAHRMLLVSGKEIYIRGEWKVQGANQVLGSTDLIEKIPIGAHVDTTCKLSKAGRLQAVKITVNNSTTYIRS